jgi:single-strand DNA-binding protein
MSDFNRVYLVGNLVKDPELKDIGNSNKVTNFTIASNRNWTGPEGQKMEEVSFLDCVAYGKRAETINTYFSKGRKMLIEGRLKQEKWTDKDTQKTQSRIRVVVEQFHFMDSKKDQTAAACVPAEAGGEDMPIDDFDSII